MSSRKVITSEELATKIAEGVIDTVLLVFPDLQGRFMGKRVTGHFWLEHVATPEGIEACNYLLAVDVDMNVLPGYRFANWDLGYGDFRAVADLSTIRIIPWLEKTALVLSDLYDVDTGAPIEVAPRQILRRQVERASAMGYTMMFGSELEFFLFRETYEEAFAKGYRNLTPHANYIQDYHILQTTKDEYVIRQIRNGMDGAGVPIEFSKGEAEWGQHEINLRYADALEMADRNAIYKNGAKEIAHMNGRAITFMAKYDIAKVGSSCHIHSSVWNADATSSLMYDHDGTHHMSDLFRWYLGGLMATARPLAWMFAHYVNSYKRYQPDSWAPTAVAWGVDNRTCGFRKVGHSQGTRVESRIPGGDTNTYLAFAATIAGGLHGISNKIEPPEPYMGNGYTAIDVERVPWNLVEAIELLEGSDIAKAAFGDDVHFHLLNTAKQEWAYFNKTVTDWELFRNFERI
ncbi:MAG: glutamine synthetase family protein [Acidimicrobiales bacterium]